MSRDRVNEFEGVLGINAFSKIVDKALSGENPFVKGRPGFNVSFGHDLVNLGKPFGDVATSNSINRFKQEVYNEFYQARKPLTRYEEKHRDPNTLEVVLQGVVSVFGTASFRATAEERLANDPIEFLKVLTESKKLLIDNASGHPFKTDRELYSEVFNAIKNSISKTSEKESSLNKYRDYKVAGLKDGLKEVYNQFKEKYFTGVASSADSPDSPFRDKKFEKNHVVSNRIAGEKPFISLKEFQKSFDIISNQVVADFKQTRDELSKKIYEQEFGNNILRR